MKRMAAVVAILALVLVGCSGSRSPRTSGEGPEPGSPASERCDVALSLEDALARDPSGDDTVEYGGIYYSVDCLGKYSWESDGS